MSGSQRFLLTFEPVRRIIEPVRMIRRAIPNLMKKPTIQDVANRAGVSRCTVSYALSHKRSISEETRSRILLAIEELGYKPDPTAIRLATGESSQPASDAAQFEQDVPTAPVVVDGVTILQVRGTSAFPADHRARVVADRIRTAAANPAVQADALRIEETEFASQIMAGTQLLIGVYDADALVEGVPRRALAGMYLNRIRMAITAYRADRSAPALRRAGIAAAVATVVFVALVVVLIWLRRKLDALLDRRYGQKIESLASKSHDVVSVKRLWDFLDAALRLVRTAVIVVLALVSRLISGLTQILIR